MSNPANRNASSNDRTTWALPEFPRPMLGVPAYLRTRAEQAERERDDAQGACLEWDRLCKQAEAPARQTESGGQEHGHSERRKEASERREATGYPHCDVALHHVIPPYIHVRSPKTIHSGRARPL